jgi:hypothetical protein
MLSPAALDRSFAALPKGEAYSYRIRETPPSISKRSSNRCDREVKSNRWAKLVEDG